MSPPKIDPQSISSIIRRRGLIRFATETLQHIIPLAPPVTTLPIRAGEEIEEVTDQVVNPETSSAPSPKQTKNLQIRNNDAPVRGRLSLFLPSWAVGRAPKWAMDVIRRGYHWEWHHPLPKLSTPLLSHQNPIVTELVEKLLLKGAIYEVPLQPCLLSRIFQVPKSDGSYRLVMDLTELNKSIMSPSFAMTNQRTLRKIMACPAWMASLDIKDAFLHIPMRQNLHKYLALTCNGRLYFFKTLPFGLTTSPRTFTFVMKHPMALLHSVGINAIVYIDDLLIWADSIDQVRTSVAKAIKLLTDLGFLLNWQKSSPIPSTTLKWLGLLWNSAEGTVMVPTEFIQEISSFAGFLYAKGKASRLQWEALMGR